MTSCTLIEIYHFQNDLSQGFEEKMMLTCAQLQEAVPNTVEYAKGAPEQIGHSVSDSNIEIAAWS